MDKHQYEPYRCLQDHGVEVPKTRQPPMNAGGKSETTVHYVAKQLVAFVGAQNYGYMTAVEVETPNGQIDCLLWGHNERLTYAVEIESSPIEEVVSDKLDRYVHQIGPIDDMVLINANNIPMDMVEAKDHIEQAIFGSDLE